VRVPTGGRRARGALFACVGFRQPPRTAASSGDGFRQQLL